MKIVESSHEAYAHVHHLRCDQQKIGLVPTMGALHQGHLSLVERSQAECDVTAVTIFVNPTQFGPHEDYGRYPRTLEADLECLSQRSVDLVFVPQQPALYPAGYSTYVEPPAEAELWEGQCRPGHFRGVLSVVLKLFQILPATVAYFGQKDFQQLTVIRRMAEDFNLPIRVQGCETVRDDDGLALSSRNRYLSAEQREAALSLWKSLRWVEQAVAEGQRDVANLEQTMQQKLYDAGAEKIDYARIVDRESLASLSAVDRPSVALIAAYVGKTRLIDNLLLDAPGPPDH